MDLEGIMPREVKSDRERQTQYDFTYMWKLENKANKHKRETDSLMQGKNRWSPQGKEAGRWAKQIKED